jgi:ribokinase
MKNNVVVVGSINTDLIVKSARFPQPGETIIGGSFSKGRGGKGANQAIAAARSGAHVCMIARIGNDSYGLEALSSLQHEKIATESIITDMETPTGMAFIFVDGNGENSIVVASGANAKLSASDIGAAAKEIVSADVLLVQLETPLDGVSTALKLARASGVVTILNPAPAQSLAPELLEQVDILTPNAVEAEVMSRIKIRDTASLHTAALTLLGFGIETVLITLGQRGVFLATKKIMEMIPAFAVEAVDSTGAGDVFSGTLAACISRETPLIDSVKKAVASASLSVTRMGAQTSVPYLSEIENMIMNYPIAATEK